MKAAPKQTNNDSSRSATEATQTSWQNQLAQFANNSKEAVAQRAFIAGINDSPHMVTQRRQIENYIGTDSQQAPAAHPTPQQINQQPIQRLEKPDDEEKELLQRKLAVESPTQLKESVPKTNNTGLPDNLKSGIESLSGLSMNNVKVHYNSSQPAQLNALAYAQGTDIHIAPGQEQHLPHEAWHVVQQAQGRVQPTMQMKDEVPVNDDQGLEHEADVMGGRAMQILTGEHDARPAPVSINSLDAGIAQLDADASAGNTNRLRSAQVVNSTVQMVAPGTIRHATNSCFAAAILNTFTVVQKLKALLLPVNDLSANANVHALQDLMLRAVNTIDTSQEVPLVWVQNIMASLATNGIIANSDQTEDVNLVMARVMNVLTNNNPAQAIGVGQPLYSGVILWHVGQTLINAFYDQMLTPQGNTPFPHVLHINRGIGNNTEIGRTFSLPSPAGAVNYRLRSAIRRNAGGIGHFISTLDRGAADEEWYESDDLGPTVIPVVHDGPDVQQDQPVGKEDMAKATAIETALDSVPSLSIDSGGTSSESKPTENAKTGINHANVMRGGGVMYVYERDNAPAVAQILPPMVQALAPLAQEAASKSYNDQLVKKAAKPSETSLVAASPMPLTAPRRSETRLPSKKARTEENPLFGRNVFADVPSLDKLPTQPEDHTFFDWISRRHELRQQRHDERLARDYDQREAFGPNHYVGIESLDKLPPEPEDGTLFFDWHAKRQELQEKQDRAKESGSSINKAFGANIYDHIEWLEDLPPQPEDDSLFDWMSKKTELTNEENTPELPPPPSKFIYYCNAPFDDYRSGDGTYMNLLVQWLNDQRNGVKAVRLFDSEKIKREGGDLVGAPELDSVNYKADWEKEPALPDPSDKTDKANQQRLLVRQVINSNHKKGEGKIISHLIAKQALTPYAQHIFHLQLRFPDSGAMFSAEGLQRLKELGFKIVITIHEMKLNRGSAEKIQKNLVQMNTYAKYADEVIFLNEHDRSNAQKLTEQGSLTTYLEDAEKCKIKKTALTTNVEHIRRLDEGARKLAGVRAGINTLNPSEVNPSGHMEDEIDTLSPQEMKAHAHVIPGIATVPGTAINHFESILSREKNILVFGSIRNLTTIETTLELAAAMAKNPRFKDTKILVVGKIMKGALAAVRELIKGTLKISNAEVAIFDKLCKQWIEEGLSENEINTTISNYVAEQYQIKRQFWDKFGELDLTELLKKMEKDNYKTIQTIKTKSPYKVKTHSEVSSKMKTLKKAVGKLEEARSQTMISGQPMDESSARLLEKSLKELHDLEKLSAEMASQRDLMETSVADVQAPYEVIKKKSKEGRPLFNIEMHFNVTDEEFAELATRCQYAYKDDEKKMADNASSIISAMAHGVMLMTQIAYDTPNEFRPDKGGHDSPVITPPAKDVSADANFVIQEIIARDSDENVLNLQTLRNMRQVLLHRYNIDTVGGRHLNLYKGL